MNCHTIVCGTSKSKQSKKCYIIEKEKFYGTLHEAGIITEEEYKSAPLDCDALAERYGICVTEIVDKTKKRYSKDKDIPNEDYEEGLRILDELIGEHKPKRILFNGKTAGGVVRDWKNFGKVQDVPPSEFIVLYGQQPWDYKGAEIWVLPNTTSRYGKENWNKNEGEEKWIEAWKACYEDCKNHQKKDP